MVNPRSLRERHTWIALVLLLAAAAQASAATLPSFNLDQSAWQATDIVMVETTTEDGTFEVIEAWKGGLQPAQRITIPELRPDADGVPISQYRMEGRYLYPENSKIPKQVPGSRLVLFLKRGDQAEPLPGVDGQKAQPHWDAGNSSHDMQTAALWIDGTTLYCFEQPMNPGPRVLLKFSRHEWDMTKSERRDIAMTTNSTRARVAHVVEAQSQLRTTIQTEDVVARAEQLKTFARSDVAPAQRLVFEELGQAGPPALPVLRAMLEGPEYKELRESVMHAYVKAGGAVIGEELSARLESELAFWKATAPSLVEGWWNARPNAPLRQRYSETLEILRGLAASRPLSALNTVIELRDFWRSLPQLDDPRGLDRMANECDQLVHDIRAK